MNKIKRIALVAHDNRKRELIEWVEWNREILLQHNLTCTGTTGKLVEKVLKLVKQNSNILKVKLIVSSTQLAAIELYKSFGFEIVGILKNELKVNDNFYDGLIMEKYFNNT